MMAPQLINPEVSIVIPTRNAGPGFEELLEKLSAQRVDFDYEIIVVDSGSTDGTVELARNYGTVHQIPRAEFNHGATRNFGLSLSRGRYVALIVQDAVPLDERWLAVMVENLEQDEKVAGVYSRQIPRAESSTLTRTLVNTWATASLERQEQSIRNLKQYRRMHPMKRRLLVAFDNVSSCLRRSVWEEIPFERTNFGEDLRWSKKVMEAGYKIVYEPRSAVLHSHERGFMYDLRRHYVNQLILSELFGLTLVPSLKRLLPGMLRSSLHLYRLLRQDQDVAEGKLKLMLLAVDHAVPTQVGTYLGNKVQQLASISPRISRKLDGFLRRGV
jgi:rhamnosyltransferase